MSKRTDVIDPPSGSESLCFDATTGLSPSFAIDSSVVCASVPLTRSAKDISVPAEDDQVAIESNSNLCSLWPLGSAVAPLSVPEQASYSVTRLAKKLVAASKLTRTRKKPAPGGSDIKLTVPLDSSSSGKPASSSQSRSSSASRPKGTRRLRQIASSAFCSGKVDDDGAMIVLSNCNYSANETFS